MKDESCLQRVTLVDLRDRGHVVRDGSFLTSPCGSVSEMVVVFVMDVDAIIFAISCVFCDRIDA